MTNPKALWESCDKYFKQNLPEEEYRNWFSGIELISFNPSTLTLKLKVPSYFISDYLDNHYTDILRTAIRSTFGRVRLLWVPIVVKYDNAPSGRRTGMQGKGPIVEATSDFFTETSADAPDTGEPQQQPGADASQQSQLPEIDSQLNNHQTFRNFIEGDSNKLCRSVGLSVSEHPNSTQFNPMFIYGPSGCGKTHLVNAMGLHCKELFPGKRVLYVSARIFVIQYMQATKTNKLNDFIAFYQTIDMLIVDDIQDWNSTTLEATHNTFFHIFNHLFRNGKRIILVSDRPPVELKHLNDRLITRFSCGLVAEMEKPNVQLCIDILKRKIARDGLVVSHDVIQYIAENANGSIRDLEGIINSLMAYSIVYNSSVNMHLVDRVLKRAVNTDSPTPTLSTIVNAVCTFYNITEALVKSRTRRQDIARPRQLIMYLADKYLKMSTTMIGRSIGGRDHSTVMHGIAQVKLYLKTNTDFSTEVQQIEREIAHNS